MSQNTYIAVNPTGRLGSALLSLSLAFAGDMGRLQQLKLDMDNMTDGASFTTLEAAFGLPAGSGATIYTILQGTLTDLTASVNLAALMNYLAATR